MAFDAGFTAAIINELSAFLINSRVEKIFQPSKESVLFVLRGERGIENKGNNFKLLIDAGSANPRIALSEIVFENPKVPPMFCMLLRKHLSGAKITAVKQLGFDRVAEIEFEARDELGFLSKKYIYAEIIGKFSNLIFCGNDKRIISAVKTNDISSASKRPVIPGTAYCSPPPQEGKVSPFGQIREEFISEYENSKISAQKFIMNRFCGLSPLVARELAFRSKEIPEKLWEEFSNLVDILENKKFVPIMIKKMTHHLLSTHLFPLNSMRMRRKPMYIRVLAL